jgi:diguanylate cyclase (GGDEF)-like protein
MHNDLDTIHRKRLIQLLILASTAILYMTIQAWLKHWVMDGLIYGAALVGFILVYLLIQKDQQARASYLFLSILIVMVFSLQWSFGGISDTSVLAYSAILAFASMIGATRFFKYLLAIIVINLLVMGYMATQGFPFETPSNNLLNAISVSIIIIVVAITIRILTKDNVSLLNELNRQFKGVQAAKDEVEHQATHDILTGLPNRLLAEERFRQIMARVQRHEGRQACLMYIDFDDFKDINDSLGHGMGDNFLIQKSRLLEANLRTEDSVCRIGGDEFMILAEDLDTAQITQLANKVLKIVQNEEEIDGNVLHCTSSIGIVVLPTDANDYEQAVQRADIAMYRSKKDGKNKFSFYDANMEEIVQRRFQLQNQFLSALVDEEFYVALQPIHNISTRELVGAEALSRWEHKNIGNINPVEFIPLAESSGFINELSSFVLDKSCEQLKTIQKTYPDFYISINISPPQLQQPQFFEDIQRIMLRHGTQPHQIKLEITESQIIERNEVVNNNLKQLHEFGIGLYLDDFGTGYSNLVHLQEMQFESIKIDRSFIHLCHQNESALVLLSSIKAMAEKLNVTIVAEGIEYEQELAKAAGLGIQKGQGYFWSKPVSTEDFIRIYIMEEDTV